MPVHQPRYSMEEFARQGTAIYQDDVRPVVEKDHQGEFVAIDIETGLYEIDPDDYTAAERLYQRVPDAQVWLMRIGQPTAYRFGLRAEAVEGNPLIGMLLLRGHDLHIEAVDGGAVTITRR